MLVNNHIDDSLIKTGLVVFFGVRFLILVLVLFYFIGFFFFFFLFRFLPPVPGVSRPVLLSPQFHVHTFLFHPQEEERSK